MAAATAWYREGTVSVTSGSRAIVGVGTSWLSQVLPGDLFYLADANGNLTSVPTEVDTVSSDTAIALKAIWPGSTVNGVKYGIVRHFNNTLPADLSARLSKLIANYQITVDQLITLLTSSGQVTITGLDGTTYSVQGLLGFANQVPDHNANDAAHSMSATGRTILRGDASAGRGALGISNHNLISVGSDGVVQVSGVQSGVESGQLRVSPTGNSNQRVSVGFNGDDKYGFIQALIAGENYYPLWLQKNGGAVLTGGKFTANGGIRSGDQIEMMASGTHAWSWNTTAHSGMLSLTDEGTGYPFRVVKGGGRILIGYGAADDGTSTLRATGDIRTDNSLIFGPTKTQLLTTTSTAAHGAAQKIADTMGTSQAAMLFVNGDNGYEGFCDVVLVAFGQSPVIVSSNTMYGAGLSHTYSVSGANVYLTQTNSGSRNITVRTTMLLRF